MSDYISREELKRTLKPFVIKKGVMENINAIPSADVISIDQANAMIKSYVSHYEENIGEWIFDDECCEHGHCSKCGYGSVDLVDGEPHNFCRKCGAKMKGGK